MIVDQRTLLGGRRRFSNNIVNFLILEPEQNTLFDCKKDLKDRSFTCRNIQKTYQEIETNQKRVIHSVRPIMRNMTQDILSHYLS